MDISLADRGHAAVSALRWVTRAALGVVFAAGLAAVVYAGTALAIHGYDTTWHGERADAAIVLGASAYHHRPSPVFRERIRHGIELWHSGRVRYLIFTGGRAPGAAWSEAEVARDYAIAHGVPPEAILLEQESTSTVENLVNARALAEQHALRSLVIVSDPPHLLRAVAIAEDLGMDAVPSATPSSRFVSWRARARFVLRESWQYLGYVALGR